VIDRYDIYMAGVGGQGIGLLAEVLVRAADRAGLAVKGCDTHGLAQRGGVVTSHLRIGKAAHSPLVSPGAADLVIGLERHEALRAAQGHLKEGGVLVWYDTVLQPLDVRLGAARAVSAAAVEEECGRRGARAILVLREDLADPRMQNVAILAALAEHKLPPGLGREHIKAALGDLMEGPALERNLALFE